MSEHARLSPSSASRWMACPASVAACASIPDDRSSVFAAEGTVAHEVRSNCLEWGFEAVDFLGQTMRADGFEFVVDEDMVDYLQQGIDWIRQQPGKLFVEHRVDLGRWLPGQFGTLDAGIVSPNLIIIDDHKYGQGVAVSPVENEQLMIYALGFWDNIARHETDATEFLISIDQPRNSRGGGFWKTDLKTLLAFGDRVREAGLSTYDAKANFNPGVKQCYWCPFKPSCDAHAAYNLDLVGQQFEDVDEAADLGTPLCLPPPASLTPERRSIIIQHSKMIEDWLDRLYADTLADAQAGRPTPFLKAVEGRAGRRAWRDEALAEARLKRFLGDDAYSRKIISPAQAEKVGKAHWAASLSPMVTQPQGKPVLVPEGDARPALKTVDEKFDEIV